MSTEPKPNDRVRAVLVSLLLVLSIVGGATAIAGPGVADGSLTDGVNDTLDDTEDELDSEETTDDATATATPTPTPDSSDSDDGSLTADVDDETDDGSTSTDDVEDSTDTDEVEGTVEGTTETVDGPSSTDSSGLVDIGALAVRPTLSATDSGWASISTMQSAGTASSGSDTSAGADPSAVAVTAGAANQAPIESAGDGPATLNFTEDDAGAFPANGTAELTVDPETGIAFDPDNSSASVSADGASAEVTDVTATTVTIAVTSTDQNATSSLHLDGVRFVATGNATQADATWTFGNASATTIVTPERLEAYGLGADVARGAHGVPDGATKLIVSAPGGAASTGFVEESRHVRVTIPEPLEDDIAFDTSAGLIVESDGSNCGLPIISDPTQEQYFLTESQILIEMSCEMGPDDYVEIKGVRFNVSGANATAPAEITAQLEVDYEPVDRIERPVIDAGNPVEAHAPSVSTTDTTVEANASNTTGDGNVTVSLSDDVGGLMGDGTRITVALEGTGVTFNESQAFDAVAISGDTPGPNVVSANATAVVLEVDGPTEAGDEFRLQRSGGDPILFDVAAGANDTAMRVTTTPGDEEVTQVTGTVVGVRGECASITAAVDQNDDGLIGDFEVLDAIEFWRDDTEVSGTCGETIDDFQVLDLIEMWRNDTEVR